MTALLMGAGYLSGAWFFVRAFFAPKWHWVGWGFLAITTFTWFMSTNKRAARMSMPISLPTA